MTTTDRLARLMRRKPVSDEVLDGRVRAKLALVCANPAAVRISIEHGCVVLSGDVLVTDRARVVRGIARVPGVDSVVDLMREHAPPVTHALAPPVAYRPWIAFARGRWPRPVRRVVAGVGAGLVVAGLGIRGRAGAALAVAGALLFARAVANARIRLTA